MRFSLCKYAFTTMSSLVVEREQKSYIHGRAQETKDPVPASFESMYCIIIHSRPLGLLSTIPSQLHDSLLFSRHFICACMNSMWSDFQPRSLSKWA